MGRRLILGFGARVLWGVWVGMGAFFSGGLLDRELGEGRGIICREGVVGFEIVTHGVCAWGAAPCFWVECRSDGGE